VGLVGLAGFRAWVPSGGAESSICLFRRATGIPCPGCGMTRAVAHLAKGEWREAAADHPFSFVLAAEAGLAWVAGGLLLLGGRRLHPPRQEVMTPIVLGHALMLVFFWLGRLATGTLPW
jgi:hypothetical protein